MPKFAANLTMMFNELDFMDRFRGRDEERGPCPSLSPT